MADVNIVNCTFIRFTECMPTRNNCCKTKFQRIQIILKSYQHNLAWAIASQIGRELVSGLEVGLIQRMKFMKCTMKASIRKCVKSKWSKLGNLAANPNPNLLMDVKMIN